MKKIRVETKSEKERKLRKSLAEVCSLLESPWLTAPTREYLLEKRRKLSQEAFK